MKRHRPSLPEYLNMEESGPSESVPLRLTLFALASPIAERAAYGLDEFATRRAALLKMDQSDQIELFCRLTGLWQSMACRDLEEKAKIALLGCHILAHTQGAVASCVPDVLDDFALQLDQFLKKTELKSHRELVFARLCVSASVFVHSEKRKRRKAKLERRQIEDCIDHLLQKLVQLESKLDVDDASVSKSSFSPRSCSEDDTQTLVVEESSHSEDPNEHIAEEATKRYPPYSTAEQPTAEDLYRTRTDLHFLSNLVGNHFETLSDHFLSSSPLFWLPVLFSCAAGTFLWRSDVFQNGTTEQIITGIIGGCLLIWAVQGSRERRKDRNMAKNELYSAARYTQVPREMVGDSMGLLAYVESLCGAEPWVTARCSSQAKPKQSVGAAAGVAESLDAPCAAGVAQLGPVPSDLLPSLLSPLKLERIEEEVGEDTAGALGQNRARLRDVSQLAELAEGDTETKQILRSLQDSVYATGQTLHSDREKAPEASSLSCPPLPLLTQQLQKLSEILDQDRTGSVSAGTRERVHKLRKAANDLQGRGAVAPAC